MDTLFRYRDNIVCRAIFQLLITDLNYDKMSLKKHFSALVFIAAVFCAQCLGAQEVNKKYGAFIKDGAISGAVIPAKADGTLKFAVLSDVHISVGAPSVAGTKACVADINDNPSIDFVIISGDIANFGSDEEIKVAKGIFDGLGKPWFIVAGNHDATWSESGTNSFLKVFGYERFDFTAGGIKFLGTQCGPNIRMAPALVPRESMLWLEEQVEKIPDGQPFFFVNHYPLDSSLLKYDEVIDVLKRKNIQMVLSGHWHVDRPMEYEGIPAAVIRSTLATNKKEIGYVIVDIAGSTVTFRDKIVGKKNPGNIWYTVRMSKGSAYDSEAKYEHRKFTFNEDYPEVKTLWSINNTADIGCAAALYRPGAKECSPYKGANALPSVAGEVRKGDIVIFADEAGYIKALDAMCGSQLWSYRTDGKIFSSPVVSGNIVIVGSSDNYIYALNAQSGKLVWKYECGKSVLGTANVFKGVAYIGASDNVFRAIDVRTGKLKWQYDGIGSFIVSRPYVDEQQVVIGDWGNKLYSFDPKSGKLQWIWNTPKKVTNLSPAQVWPVKSNGRIFIVTPDRISYVLDAKTGNTLASNYGGRESIGLSADGSAYYIKSMKDTVRAYSTSELSYGAKGTTSKVLWNSVTGYEYEIAPTPMTVAAKVGKEGKGILFVPTDKGNIFALNCADGSVVWKHRAGGALVNYILPVGDRQLLVNTMDGVVALLQY